MFVRLVYFNFGPGQRRAAEELAAELRPLIRSQPGSPSVTFFGDDTDGQYGIFVLWDTQAHADAAAAVVGPRLEKHLAGKVKGQPIRRLLEVIEAP
jgi:heme-degrading monooxygenase HmoA